MKIRYYVADAFTDHVFGGGPAGVVFTEEWLSEETMQNIASENNLADTAFVVPQGDEFGLRWFMPEGEINLNGHATLGASYCLFRFLYPDRSELAYNTKSGRLTVTRQGDLLCLDLPAVYNKPVELTEQMIEALGDVPSESYFGENYLFVFDSWEKVRDLKPDFGKMKELPLGSGVFVTAEGGEGCDIVGRTFWPKMGVNEDPVCGNMHCNLTPFWRERLGKTQLVSHQLSRRGAEIICELSGDRAILKGKAALFLATELEI